jgi:hypothetical protein
MPVTSVPRKSPVSVTDNRKLLVERLAASSYLSKSARLRDMFLYLCERVLDHSVEVIHEHEVGHKVFGRPLDYDTNADNIVRVHASTLRKRIEQYFANEGSHEPVLIDIPRGNYAPVFRKRPAAPLPTAFPPEALPVSPVDSTSPTNWKLGLLIGLSVLLFCSTLFLLLRVRTLVAVKPAASPAQVVLRPLWSDIFAADKVTDIVLDDAALGFFQELTGHQVGLSEYFDRSYVRSVEQSADKSKLPPEFAETLVLKRQSSYADASLLWKLAQTAEALHSNPKLHFARDYSFRELKADNAILLGNSRSNPWIEPFESHMSLQWKFDSSMGSYYPLDSAAQSVEGSKYHATGHGGEPREGYATVSLLPNLSGTGKVLIISGTGGAAVSSALDFLSDQHSLSQLRSLLPKNNSADFPYFEALLRVKSRNTLPRDTEIVICRAPKA